MSSAEGKRKEDARMRHRSRHEKHGFGFSVRAVAVMLALIVFLIGSISASYYLLRWVFNLVGTPADLVALILITFLGLFIYAGILRTIGVIMKRAGHKHREWHSRLYYETLEALEKITTGNFDVSIEPSPHDRDEHGVALAQSVNRMARELGSMEQLRTDFVSNVSHEIQSPLTSISGFAELLKKPDLPEEKRLHYLTIIETESRRLSKLSENLLKLSSLESEQTPFSPAPYRLDMQLQDAVLMLEPHWNSKGIVIEMDIEEPESIVADMDLLDQVWINLLTNSIKFTPAGGTISVTSRDEGERVTVSITDTGCGISQEDQLRVFERFYKADKSRDRSLGGNGLGLSLVRKIVRMHGGEIELRSALGEGATFVVTIPKAQLQR